MSVKMKKTVGYFTEENLKNLSSQPNTVVYKPTHDIVFEAWPANKVSTIVDRVIAITKDKKDEEEIKKECMKDEDIKDFSEKYTTMFKNLVRYEFVEDSENVKVMKQLIFLKSAVDNNVMSMKAAEAQASKVSLESLYQRANDKA